MIVMNKLYCLTYYPNDLKGNYTWYLLALVVSESGALAASHGQQHSYDVTTIIKIF